MIGIRTRGGKIFRKAMYASTRLIIPGVHPWRLGNVTQVSQVVGTVVRCRRLGISVVAWHLPCVLARHLVQLRVNADSRGEPQTAGGNIVALLLNEGVIATTIKTNSLFSSAGWRSDRAREIEHARTRYTLVLAGLGFFFLADLNFQAAFCKLCFRNILYNRATPSAYYYSIASNGRGWKAEFKK